MRIKLKEGKQKELILLGKNKFTWKKLASQLKINSHYLSIELKNEERFLSNKIYQKLCEISNVNFDIFIEKKLEDNWGKSKGGSTQKGDRKWNLKKIKEPIKSKKLAELCGIILGDGHVEYYTKGKKNRSYSLTITGHSIEDYHYLANYTSKIIKSIFKEKPKIRMVPNNNVTYIRINGKNLVIILNKLGLKSGNKKKNNQGIPKWIKEDNKYLKACIRGLIDTDGSIHKISKENKNLRICFTSYISLLLNDVKESFEKLGYTTSKIIKGNQIFITKKDHVKKYIKEIKFSNQKHLKRIKRLTL